MIKNNLGYIKLKKSPKMGKYFFYTCFFLFFVLSAAYTFSQDQNDNNLFQLAQSYERSGDADGALKIYKNLYDKFPFNNVFYDSYRRCLEYFKKYPEAISIIQSWIGNHIDDIEQMANLVNDYRKNGQLNESEEILNKTISIAPHNINIYRTLGAKLLEGKFYEKALELFLQGRKECNIPNIFLVEVASLYAILENYESSITEYLKILENDPNQLGYLQSLLISYTDDPSFLKLTIKIINNKIAAGNSDISFYYLLSWLYGEQKNYEDAFSVHLKIEKIRNSNGLELYNFADRAFRDKVFDVAAKAYKVILDEYSKSNIVPNAKFGYAQCLEELNNRKISLPQDSAVFLNKDIPASESMPLYSGVISLYEEIVKNYPGTSWAGEALFKIGNLKLKKFFDLDGASKSFEEVNHHIPLTALDLKSMLKIGDILVMQNRLNDATRKFEFIMNFPSTVENSKDIAKFKIAEINYFLGKFSICTKQLEELSKNLSADITNDALLLLNFIQSNKSPDSVALQQYSMAELLEKQKKITEAIAIYENIITRFPGSSLVDESYFKIAGLETFLKNYSKAVSLFEDIIKKFPDGLLIDKSYFYLAEIYQFGLRNNQRAVENYDKILRDFPNSFYVNKARKRIRELRGESL